MNYTVCLHGTAAAAGRQSLCGDRVRGAEKPWVMTETPGWGPDSFNTDPNHTALFSLQNQAKPLILQIRELRSREAGKATPAVRNQRRARRSLLG